VNCLTLSEALATVDGCMRIVTRTTSAIAIKTPATVQASQRRKGFFGVKSYRSAKDGDRSRCPKKSASKYLECAQRVSRGTHLPAMKKYRDQTHACYQLHYSCNFYRSFLCT